ncbi:MAG: polysaccharide export protein [Deltaproteobacteria bacterium]|jgi:polysaccharide export outer membrane protein|nr:polysaccharide export protein [Deltaproteobacteria bacterium]MBW2534658.1 polysaccharide export protein [Deltaproteobacteria bacterium]
MGEERSVTSELEARARRSWTGRGRWLWVALLLVLALGCERRAKPPELPPPVQASTVGVGDVFELHIIGEEDLPTEYTVAPNGTVDLPYINRVEVAGLEPHEISDLVRNRLIAADVLTKPVVVVNIKAYNSKRVEVFGEVDKPGSFPLEPGMTLLRAISQAGGFNTIADTGNVTIRRKVDGGIKAARVDVQAIIDNEIPDVLLQSGDSIHVGKRVF